VHVAYVETLKRSKLSFDPFDTIFMV